jgi:L-asparaginase II
MQPNPPLCYTTRSHLIEIVHHGIVCCTELSSDGSPKILCQVGDIDRLFYPRSAMKFVQILPLLESGAADYYDFTDRELSVMCASHNSEGFHLETVRNILSKIALHENDLACGGHTPISEEAAFEYVREGVQTPFRAHIYNNCSGKHAGFLALCKYLNHPIEGYLSPSHPIQRLIREAVSDVFQISDEELYAGVDGCRFTLLPSRSHLAITVPQHSH